MLLERVWAQPLRGVSKEIIVIESNSTDGSREIIETFIAAHPDSPGTQVRLILQPIARGKGAATREGLASASGDIVIIQDADLEYDTADYPDLLEPIIAGRCEFVLGSRHLGTNSWKIRQFARGSIQAAVMDCAGLLFRALFNSLYPVQLTDPTTMFKVFRHQCIEGMTFSCNRFDFDFELLGKLILAGFIPLELPVSYKSRGFDEGKKIRFFRDPPGWILVILKTRFQRIGTLEQRIRAKELTATEVAADPVALSRE
jgi:glycosyltransferase involved in cell wall biosynthesis